RGETEAWFDHHPPLAIDQSGFPLDLDLREAARETISDLELRTGNHAAGTVDKAIESAQANQGAVFIEAIDPVELGSDQDRAVAADRSAQPAGKAAHRQRKPGRRQRATVLSPFQGPSKQRPSNRKQARRASRRTVLIFHLRE